MKYLYVIIFLIIASPVFSNKNAQRKVVDIRKYQNELNLTQEQMVKLKAIYSKNDARLLLQAPAQNWREDVKKRNAIRQEMRKEVRQVLTSEQLKAYVQLRQKQQQQAAIKKQSK
ncbi:MAG: hypothetical protein JW735_10110 [Prolixibacteraceae bacterium]|nr:hypothetical protein [Prolixibacteraceae bacterium]